MVGLARGCRCRSCIHVTSPAETTVKHPNRAPQGRRRRVGTPLWVTPGCPAGQLRTVLGSWAWGFRCWRLETVIPSETWVPYDDMQHVETWASGDPFAVAPEAVGCRTEHVHLRAKGRASLTGSSRMKPIGLSAQRAMTAPTRSHPGSLGTLNPKP